MKMRRISAALAVSVMILAPPTTARIGYGVSGVDDATVLWRGVWEVAAGIEGGSGYVLDGKKIDLVRVPTSLRYGWQDRTEFGLTVPFAYQKSDHPLLDGSGLSDLVFGMKYQMSKEEGSSPASSAELKAGWGPNSTVGSHAYSFGAVYALSKSFRNEEMTGHMNLGYTIYTANRADVFSWGVGLEQKMSDSLRGTVSVGQGNQVIPGITKDIVIEGGVAKRFNPTLEYMLSAGIGVTGNAPNWQMRTGLKMEFGREAGSATVYRKGEWKAPAPPSALEEVYQGEAAMRNRDYEAAAGYYSAALAKDSTVASAWNNRGIALFNLGRTSDALDCYERAARLDEKNAGIRYNMGLAQYRSGDLIAARRSFVRALELDPQFDQARSSLTALDALGEKE